MRVGFGFDIHRLRKGRGFHLGGMYTACGHDIIAHSDGDIVLHAVSDALLGAIGEGDTGRFFPPGKKNTKDIRSSRILDYALRLAGKKGYKLSNVDVTVVSEAFPVKPLRAKVAGSVARLCGLQPADVNVKAKTMEGLGDIGKKKAVACYAVVLVERFKRSH